MGNATSIATDRFSIEAARSVAFDSPDHLMPHGTKRDNSRNPMFNRKLSLLFPDRRLRVMDVGCSGGGFVKSCLEDGHVAIGLEGSDYSLRHKRAEWATIPECLFTCDVTANFAVKTAAADPAAFDVITAWEVMEHIRTADLPQVCDNMMRHLAPGGLWIMSVAPIEDVINGVRLHQTVQDSPWWIDFFSQQGFQHHPHLVRYFGDDWVRGRFQGAPVSFHVILTRMGEAAPALPPASLRLKLATVSSMQHAPAKLKLAKIAVRDAAGRVFKPISERIADR
jgi:SAM-dependent methyltransferase